MSNLIIIGNAINKNWPFKKGLEDGSGEKWEVRTCTTNKFNGVNKYTRYLKYFSVPFSVFLNRKKYEKIVTWDQFFGLVLACYMRFFKVKKTPDIYAMAFIYRPKHGLVRKIYEKFVRYAITSGKLKKVILFSDSEAEYYANFFNVSKTLFISETLGVEDVAEKYNHTVDNNETYYVSPGRSNRDYDSLYDAWPQDEDNLYIICDTRKENDKSNVIHKRDCHGEEYLKAISKAKAVIIPLLDEKVSSGQLVFEHAAMFGKPVIVSENNTLERYIENNKTGFIIPKTKEALIDAVSRLKDEETYKEMSKNARKKFEADFNVYNLGKRIGEITNA